MKKIIAATGNKNKLIELRRILEPLGFEVLSADKDTLSGIVENGETFEENALIKARTVFKKTNIPTIADDSGICIDFLDGNPGVYSARYLGENTSYLIKNAKILEILKEVPLPKRGAHYECVIAIVTEKGENTFSGICNGYIGFEPKGENGFGYDPIFYTGNKSYSQLSNIEKDEISHRGNALKQLSLDINNIKF